MTYDFLVHFTGKSPGNGTSKKVRLFPGWHVPNRNSIYRFVSFSPVPGLSAFVAMQNFAVQPKWRVLQRNFKTHSFQTEIPNRNIREYAALEGSGER